MTLLRKTLIAALALSLPAAAIVPASATTSTVKKPHHSSQHRSHASHKSKAPKAAHAG